LKYFFGKNIDNYFLCLSVCLFFVGAGGNGNVLKEICDPLGALLQIRSIPVGDPTLSVLEIWGAEYQENNAILVLPDNLEIVRDIGIYCNDHTNFKSCEY
jgi:hypothetical protein